MKRAQNVLEMALLLCLIVVISISVLTIYNKLKTKLTGMSKSTLHTQTK